MASKNFINGQLCVARVNSQPFLQCLGRGRIWAVGSWRLGLLSTEYVGGLAGLGPGCVVVVVIRDIHWRPKALEQQYLHLGKAELLSDVRFCYQFASSDEIAACGVCP